ncbi:MAG: tetratricopeptide repeat-containing sensor histidine kinase [Bacteroidota bacterium]
MPQARTHTFFLRFQRRVGSIALPIFFFVLLHPISGQQDTRDSLALTLRVFEKKGLDTLQSKRYIDMINQLGSAYRFVKLDSLYNLSQRALSLSKARQYTLGECRALTNIGDYYSDKGESEKSIRYYQKSFVLADSLGNAEIKAGILNDLGAEYSYSGNYAEALKSYLQGIDLAKEIDNKLMLSIINENIAGLYSSQKEYGEALEFYEEVQKINEAIGDELIMAETFSNLAELYSQIGDYQQAMLYVNKSIATFEENEIYDWLAFAYGVKGEIYLAQKKYRWALHWFDQSNLLHKNLEDDRSRIDLLNGLAASYLGLDEDAISEQYALEGFSIAKKIKSLESQRDCAETLYRIHKNGEDYKKALYYHEIFQALSDSLFKDENKKTLTLLKTKLSYDKQKAELILNNQKALAKQRNYINLSIIVLIILLAAAIPLYFNQKKLRRLYRELQTNTKNLRDREAELHGINKTKDKLFSIIGHDLRGPIGALQGMLKLFSSGDIARKDFSKYIPKLKTDVDHILFTLNNLLSWGHAQMNGTVSRPKMVSINKLVGRNISLLSELAEKKSIKILDQIPDNSLAFADENQIDVVLRNLLSNGIKFTPKNGLITLEAEEDSEHWKIKVRDTGVGMDQSTQQLIFNENSSITTYGTNDEKGTGLGLSLCQEMVVKNRGKIWVESAPKKGSTFYFTIPKVTKRYQKAS